MRTIAFIMQKGGVGKSTSAAALAYGLENRGNRVLMIDADPQQNLSFIVGADVTSIDATLYDVWHGKVPIGYAVHMVEFSLDLITGGLALASADFEFSGKPAREQLLARSLQPIRDKYDYIIIDCPPSLGLMTMTAATAADSIIIPCGTDILSLQGLVQLWDFIDNIRLYCNADLDVDGILLTMYDDNVQTTKILESQIENIAALQETRVFNTKIHRSQAIKTAQAKRDITVFDRKSRAAADYNTFVVELLNIYDGGKK